MNTTDHSFGKKHRLSSHTLIERLFGEGSSFFAYPFRCVWMLADLVPGREAAGVQVLVSVSKRNHKRAVRRNILKRRTREAYRLNRLALDAAGIPENRQLLLAFIYSSKEVLDYSTIEHGVIKVLSEVSKRLAGGVDPSVRAAD